MGRSSVVTVWPSFVVLGKDFRDRDSVYYHLPRYLLWNLPPVMSRAGWFVYTIPCGNPTTCFQLELPQLLVTARIQDI